MKSAGPVYVSPDPRNLVGSPPNFAPMVKIIFYYDATRRIMIQKWLNILLF